MILEDSWDMPPEKRGRRGVSDADDEDDDYRRKRDRNNEAVKKSRYKSKQRTQETFTRVNKLKAENQALEEKVKTLTKDLQFLKELFMEYASNTDNPKFEGIDLNKLLEDVPDEKKGSSSKS
ncbi:CCAAT/enhancer-binding protein gamma-like [Maniola jurtina]|uniref:CCAAT/enhancer-binding protein gamma-like n=1 Tax=Maniola jurtina TaxID=191418 RepID=UPI001E6885B3|nr:CCAAT/enhancer-binding protein gamma-like [Maniola jurtina]XP_045762604.1 CCAAT/enhancer-binding protein gamma-like [Maniola jurtina]XP_045762605.1 CCAAT/enhancer-binding protein gamma-like [Maniola jurtina]